MTPIDDLKRQAENRPNGLALIARHKTWTYRRLQDHVEELARGLIARGVKAGDRVVLHFPNSPEMVIAYYACFRIGAIAAPLNLRFKGAELERMLRRLRPSCYLGEETLHEHAQGVAVDALPPAMRFVIGPSGRPSGAQPWSALFAGADETAIGDRIVPTAPAVLLTTSGTTGEPKFVAHTPATLSAITEALAGFELDGGQIVISATPMVHASGLMILLSAIRVGAPVVLLPAFDADSALDAIAAYDGSWLLGMPFMFEALLERQQQRPRAVDSLRFCVSAGDVCPVDLQERFEAEFGLPLRTVWGSTETAGALLHGLRLGAVNRIAPGAQIRLTDQHGRSVAAGAIGELEIRGPNVTPGYWMAPDHIAPIAPDGWYRTGDLMRQEGNELWFVSRKKDLIVRGGSNIAPAEVEQALKTHPLVIDAAVVGIADKLLGQRVAAAVQLVGVVSAGTLETIRLEVSERLADYKVPEWLVALDAIPRNPLGKVDRTALGVAAIKQRCGDHDP